VARSGRGDLGRKYLRAARQRFIAVELLFEEGLNFEAAYLAGYVIECSLKAIILSQVSVGHRDDYANRYFRGRPAHDFEMLRRRLAELGVEAPAQVRSDLRFASWWSTDLRYEVGYLDEPDVKDFIAAAERVLRWAQRSI
jgi:HEPN domain-containing protein